MPTIDDFRFVDRRDETLVKGPGSINGQQFVVNGAVNCRIFLIDDIDSVLIENCVGCTFVIVGVTGSCFVRKSEQCEATIATRQFRTRDLQDCTFWLFALTNPSIELSSRLRIGPWNARVPHAASLFARLNFRASENAWRDVYDFNAGNESVPMPHFTLVDSAAPEVDFGDLGLGAPSENPCSSGGGDAAAASRPQATALGHGASSNMAAFASPATLERTERRRQQIDADRAAALDYLRRALQRPIGGGDDDDDALVAQLESGELLCEFAAALVQQAVPHHAGPRLNQFQRIENLNSFCAVCGELGVKSELLFEPTDLLERRNLGRVYACICSCAEAAAQAAAATAAQTAEPVPPAAPVVHEYFSERGDLHPTPPLARAVEVINFYSKNDPFYEFANFWPAQIALDGAVWPTSEHYFQGGKFVHEPAIREQVRCARFPSEAFDLARQYGRQVVQGWHRNKGAVMLEACRAKFSQHPRLRELLLSTGNAFLVEHTTRDNSWGDGGDGSGANRLGWTLMVVRAELRGDSKDARERTLGLKLAEQKDAARNAAPARPRGEPPQHQQQQQQPAADATAPPAANVEAARQAAVAEEEAARRAAAERAAEEEAARRAAAERAAAGEAARRAAAERAAAEEAARQEAARQAAAAEEAARQAAAAEEARRRQEAEEHAMRMRAAIEEEREQEALLHAELAHVKHHDELRNWEHEHERALEAKASAARERKRAMLAAGEKALETMRAAHRLAVETRRAANRTAQDALVAQQGAAPAGGKERAGVWARALALVDARASYSSRGTQRLLASIRSAAEAEAAAHK